MSSGQHPTGATSARHHVLCVCLTRDLDSLDDLHFGVHESMMYALNTPPVQGAQWTGIVTQASSVSHDLLRVVRGVAGSQGFGRAVEGLAGYEPRVLRCSRAFAANHDTQIAIAMLESGAVEAVVCVQSDPEDRFTPRPVGSAYSSACAVARLMVAGCCTCRIALQGSLVC